jgi:hypothetical protein
MSHSSDNALISPINKNFKKYDGKSTKSIQDAFLLELKKRGNVYKTCIAMGLPRSTVYTHWSQDPDFKAKFDEWQETLLDGIEGRLFQEALHNEKSFVPAIFMLKAWRPERYGDKLDIHNQTEIGFSFEDRATALISELGYPSTPKGEIVSNTTPQRSIKDNYVALEKGVEPSNALFQDLPVTNITQVDQQHGAPITQADHSSSSGSQP